MQPTGRFVSGHQCSGREDSLRKVHSVVDVRRVS
jgi:hypothetical protein